MTTSINYQIERLKVLLPELRQRATRGDIEATEAMVEAFFRIALHPDMPGSESIEWLLKAMRIDGANPRYPYHIARICLIEGDLDGAAKWLKETNRHCKTSHRLWTHVSILQQELNSRYKGQKDYEPDGLKLRADAITQAIKEGRDHFADDWISFVPPKSLAALEEEARRTRETGGDHDRESKKVTRVNFETAHTENLLATSAHSAHRTGIGDCRWSGVIDLEIERLLEDEPSNRGRDRILPLLENVVKLSREREGGDTRFVILAVQWLLCGYPVASVRRLIAESRGQSEAIFMLESVCRLFQTPLESIAGRLSSCLERNEIPPLIAALIHHRRLLWRPVTFQSAYAYLAARQLIGLIGTKACDPETIEQIDSLIKTLIEAGRLIDVPMPVLISEVGKQEETQTITEGDACDELKRLESSLIAAGRILERGLEFLKEAVAAAAAIESEESYAFVRSNIRACQVFREQLVKTGSLGKAQLERLLSRIIELPSDRLDLKLQTKDAPGSASSFGSRFETVKKGFNNLKLPTTFNKLLRSAEQRLSTASRRFSSIAEIASPRITKLPGELAAVLPEVETGPGGEVATGIEPASDTSSNNLEDVAKAANPWEEISAGIGGLSRVLELIDQKLDNILKENLATFKPYTERQMALPELRLLQFNLLSQAAETYWRLGRFTEARSIWQKCLSLDRLSIPALTNLAVNDTISAVDHAQTLKSWMDCSEALYFLAVAAGTPRMASAQRVGFHQRYASACSGGAFQDQKDQDEDPDWGTKVMELLNAPGRLSDFIAHKLAELLNRRLAISTPTLLLGVPRTGKQKTRCKVKEQLERLILQVTADLSPRVGPNFKKMCSDYLEKALQSCTESRNLTLARNPKYKSDQDLLVHQLKDLYDLKFRFFCFFLTVPSKGKRIEWESQLQSVESLILLDVLNSFPTPTDCDFIHSAVRGPAKMLRTSPEEVVDKLDNYLSEVFLRLVNGIVERKDRSQFGSLACALSMHRDFFRNRLSKDQFKFLDDPVPLYPEEVQAQIANSKHGDSDSALKVIDLLETWCARYPALTGPSRRIAVLLFRRDPKRAIKHLEKAIAWGAFSDGVKQCLSLLRQIRIAVSIEEKNFQLARQFVLELLDDNPTQEVFEQLLVVYSHWFNEQPNKIVILITWLEEDFSRVTKTIGTKVSKSGPVTNSEIRAERDAPIIRKRNIIINAILHKLGRPSGPAEARKILPALQAACEKDSGNMTAMHFLAVCYFQLGSEEFQKSAADRGKKNFDIAHDIALNVSKKTSDRELVAEASVIVEEAKKILKLLQL
jgi:tetratricopeptide (TPR) repeat protein